MGISLVFGNDGNKKFPLRIILNINDHFPILFNCTRITKVDRTTDRLLDAISVPELYQELMNIEWFKKICWIGHMHAGDLSFVLGGNDRRFLIESFVDLECISL